MSHVIGFGRRARETYPQGPGSGTSGGAGALLLVGYDGTVEEFVASAPEGMTDLPRNGALDPIQVTFPSFALGDTLEVDFRLNGRWSSATPGEAEVTTQVIVSLDGGATFYILIQSSSVAQVAEGGTEVLLLRSLDAITIVDPMPITVNGVPSTIPVTAPPIVRVQYDFSGTGSPGGAVLLNGGIDELELPGAILKCSELAAASVFQGPIGTLAI